jgi:hypothetical protein
MQRRMRVVYTLILPGILLSGGLNGAVCGQGKADALSGPSKLMLENERVRVSEITVAPKGQVPKPAWPSVELEDKSGPGAKRAWETVNVRWTEPDKSPATALTGWHAVRIELKEADCPPGPAILPPTDITKIPNSGFTVELENRHMRVLHGRLPAGEKEPWHTHTWPAVVCYFGLPQSRRIEADGTIKPRAAFTELQVNFDMGKNPSHTIENLGTTLYQAYRTELKPVLNTH